MALVKVDIKTGEVRENRLREYWARGSLQRREKQSRPAPSRKPGPGEDRELMARIKKFSGSIRKLSNSWNEEELYRLAVLVGREKLTYKQAAAQLGRSYDACKYMYRRLKKAGVI